MCVTVCNWPNFFKLTLYSNRCQSFPSSTILVSLWFIIVRLRVFLSYSVLNYYFQVSFNLRVIWYTVHVYVVKVTRNIYFLLTELEGPTVSYGPSFFPFDLLPKHEVHGP